MSDKIFIENKCKICGKEFKSLDPIGYHLKRCHNITCQEYYDKFYKKENEGFCKTCGKPTVFFKLRYGYQAFCSSTCASRNKEWLLNREKTCLKKYNAKNYAASIEGKEKIKHTNLEKYGVTCTLNTEENIKKKKETWIKNYNTDNPAKNTIIQDKIKQTCLEKYGTYNYSLSNEFKNNIEKYQNKAKQTCLEKYGVENIVYLHDMHVKIHKKYKYNNINFDSSWEIAYYIWLKDNNINFEYQPDIKLTYEFNNKIYQYYPDFKIGEQLIEIKSDYLYKKMQKINTKENAKYNCALNNNVNFLLEKDIKFYLNYINENYGKNYLKQFKNL